jgi:hypothetical protein
VSEPQPSPTPSEFPNHEFGFELRVCAWAERGWEPADPGSAVLVGRQVGTRHRRWDTVVVEADPEAVRERAAFGARELDSDLLWVVRHAPAEWTWYRDALPRWCPWRYVREAVHRAADRGLVARRREGNRIQIRRERPYPDWVRRLIAIENKPDLDRRAADALADQLERDVAGRLADEVWVATRETDERIEPVLLEDLPVEAGVLAFEGPTEARVAWHAAGLPAGEEGTRILERPAGGDFDASAARFEYVDADEVARTRLELAERVYGRGWRSYQRTMRPDCRHFDLERGGAGFVPVCRAKGCEPTAGECAGDCPVFEPEPPAWRTKGWPVEGGPGATVKRLLAERRRRRRPGR